MTEIRDAYKLNIIELVKHHRKTCEGETCNISLNMVLQMLKLAGYKFTEEEERLFY